MATKYVFKPRSLKYSQPRSEVKAEDSGNEEEDQNGGQAAKPCTFADPGLMYWVKGIGCPIQLVIMGDNVE